MSGDKPPLRWPAARLHNRLSDLGQDLYTGVPCSLLRPLYTVLDAEPGGYVPAPREDIAVAFATGAALGGRRPVVLMQNSGLALCGNALTTLPALYEVPLLLVVSWRGYGPDAPEHVVTGERTTQVLAAFDLPYGFLDDVGDIVALADKRRGPAAVLVRPGDLT